MMLRCIYLLKTLYSNYMNIILRWENCDIIQKHFIFSNQNNRIWLIECIDFIPLTNCSCITNTRWYTWQWILIKCKKMSDVRMCMQLVRHYLKISIKYFVEDSFTKLVEQFNWDFWWSFSTVKMYRLIWSWDDRNIVKVDGTYDQN